MLATLSCVFKINETDGGINNAEGTEGNSEGEYKRFEGDRNDKNCAPTISKSMLLDIPDIVKLRAGERFVLEGYCV